MWTGDYVYLLRQLVIKDFTIRYRRMSLGIFWSLLNPLVMMGVYSFVFSRIFKSAIEYFPLHLLAGILLFNLSTLGWLGATTSILDNAGLVKRNPVSREIIPLASVLSSVPHFLIQVGLLLAFVFSAGLGINIQWLWLPVVWSLLLISTIGFGLITSAAYVLVRDTRYIVESINVVLFWVVPIIYRIDMVPESMRSIYLFNPIAAAVLSTQDIIIRAQAPSAQLLLKLALVSVFSLGAGLSIFRQVKRKFYEYL